MKNNISFCAQILNITYFLFFSLKKKGFIKPFKMMVYSILLLLKISISFKDKKKKYATGVTNGPLKLLPKKRLKKPMPKIKRLEPDGSQVV